ncbi:membrane peptidoglycan carboxypeptidase [Actinocorallia herbida]|uniref:Membrane peptidoglycan carboxypeptidase n=1 Tax=Actinocorallia herbida TaxID=58109 RepID=A0A3N1D7X1_9ACTN|nr:transglycosylase domain-containing protein [Actinocorallia herbida]ROO89559.1 membrane peptidoglycan carboxypeptidase [Actinocorallia herbida]
MSENGDDARIEAQGDTAPPGAAENAATADPAERSAAARPDGAGDDEPEPAPEPAENAGEDAEPAGDAQDETPPASAETGETPAAEPTASRQESVPAPDDAGEDPLDKVEDTPSSLDEPTSAYTPFLDDPDEDGPHEAPRPVDQDEPQESDDPTRAFAPLPDESDDLYAPFRDDFPDEDPAEVTRIDPAEVTRMDTVLPTTAAFAAVAASDGADGADGGGPSDPGPPSSSAASPQPGLPRKRGRWVRRLSWSVLVLLGLGVIAFAIAYKLTPVPETQQLSAREQLNVFYYSDGKTVLVEEGTNRRPVDLVEISLPVQEAVISAENRSFRTDPGVSFSGTFRAFWSTATGKQVQGGSTITQQMVRNYYSGLSQERSIFRKLKEVMVSLKVSQSRDKDWIMEQYLNTIYFGRQSYGIQAAAQSYFKVDAKDLDPAQSAFLAAAIQQPTPFSKVTKDNRAAVEERWRYVVKGMVEAKDLTQAEADALKFPVPVKEKQKNIYRGQVGYMVNIAKKELREQRGIDDEDLALGGLRIVTTFRKPLMDAAVKAVTDNVPADMPKEQRIGLTSVDPSNGEVVAMYGGRDYLKEAMSSSFGLKAQAGSGFKPFVLAAALESGVRLSDTYSGAAPLMVGNHAIENSSGHSYGYLNLVQMTRDSANTAYVRLGQEIGNDKVTAMAESLGIPESQLTANGADTTAVYPLGVADVSPAQQAGAYAAFANEGVWYKPHVIKSITGRKKVERKVKNEGVRVMSKDTAADATYAMEQVVNSGTGTAANLYDRDAAGKTGTTDGGAAVWFNGYVPQLSTSVGIFQSKNLSKSLDLSPYSAYGGVLPAMVWRQYMETATAGMEVKEFPDPVTYDYTPQYQYNPDDDNTTSPGNGPDTSTPTDGENSGEPTGETPEDPDQTDPGTGEDPGEGDGGDDGAVDDGGDGAEPGVEPGAEPDAGGGR